MPLPVRLRSSSSLKWVSWRTVIGVENIAHRLWEEENIRPLHLAPQFTLGYSMWKRNKKRTTGTQEVNLGELPPRKTCQPCPHTLTRSSLALDWKRQYTAPSLKIQIDRPSLSQSPPASPAPRPSLACIGSARISPNTCTRFLDLQLCFTLQITMKTHFCRAQAPLPIYCSTWGLSSSTLHYKSLWRWVKVF